MSLFDYLNNDSLSSVSSSSSSSQISLLLQQAQAKQGIVVPAKVETAAETSSTATSNQSSVSITLAAQRANASATDAKKDAATLAEEVRAALDEHYADGGKSPSVSAFSARALALVALNEDGSFSKAEVAAAKSELRERDRLSALSFINSGELTAASLKSYSQQVLAAREGMSKEERLLRDSDPHLR